MGKAKRANAARAISPRLPGISREAFVARWSGYAGAEMSAYQSHFNDLCALVGHETPTEADSSASWFCFQKSLAKEAGGVGFADVYHRSRFGWEYKGNHGDLDKAYVQLLQYRMNLNNPPLLIVSDFRRFVVRTNFTDSVTKAYEFTLDDLLTQDSLAGASFSAMELLRRCFFDPHSLNPNTTPEALTQEAAERFSALADGLRKVKSATYDAKTGGYPREYTDLQIARFLMRMVFCMFASDVGLLPPNVISSIVDRHRSNSRALAERLKALFHVMTTGGPYGSDDIPFFNGGLFANVEALEISSEHVDALRDADQLDWQDIEPSIFGTLFERILDEKRRTQIGAHYTSREDIELIVRPVVMRPLEEEWARVEAKVSGMRLSQGGSTKRDPELQAAATLQAFLDRLGKVRVLDPACGSGNFLYVSLALLKALEQRVLTFGSQWGTTGLQTKVHPRQLLGIEVDPYAHEIASIVVWIGYLQWKKRNGVPFELESPILEPFTNFSLMSAITGQTNTGRWYEPDWPEAEFIVGNPPFLGGKKLRESLGDDEVDGMFEIWDGRVARESDLCCYWFEKARAQIANGRTRRAGLLATQGVRGGKNREVLKAIKRSGDIFFAVDDRKWVLGGAAVRVSMVGFDDGSEKRREWVHHERGELVRTAAVAEISAALTAETADTTTARGLAENRGISFMGDTKVGPFELTADMARAILASPNPDGRHNRDVVRPWVNGLDITRRPRGMWIVDFPPGTTEAEAANYRAPFQHVLRAVKPERVKNARKVYAERWWIHAEARPEMRAVVWPRSRFICTPRVSKHRLFGWLVSGTLADSATIVFARDDDYFFGVLHSRAHEVWSLSVGTQLRESESGARYTPSTCFETFPLPWPPGMEDTASPHHAAISVAARTLNDQRERWLNPVLQEGQEVADPALALRTLTNLYNRRDAGLEQWLVNLHGALDQAVFAAYGWPYPLTNDEVLQRLLAENLRRAEPQGSAVSP